MSNFMTRKLSLREKIILLVFVVILLIGLYFLLVHYPIVNRNKEIDEEMVQTQADQIQANIDKAEYDKIEAEKEHIEEQKANGENVTYMPEYDNFANLNTKLDEIFAKAKDKFKDEKAIDRQLRLSKSENEETGIVTRTLTFSFSCSSYEEAKFIINELSHIKGEDPNTEWRSLLSSLSITATKESNVMMGSVLVSGTMTFYERKEAMEQSDQE